MKLRNFILFLVLALAGCMPTIQQTMEDTCRENRNGMFLSDQVDSHGSQYIFVCENGKVRK